MKLSKGILAYLENLVACFELKPHGPEIVYPNPSKYYGEKKYPAAEEYFFPACDRVGSVCAAPRCLS